MPLLFLVNSLNSREGGGGVICVTLAAIPPTASRSKHIHCIGGSVYTSDPSPLPTMHRIARQIASAHPYTKPNDNVGMFWLFTLCHLHCWSSAPFYNYKFEPFSQVSNNTTVCPINKPFSQVSDNTTVCPINKPSSQVSDNTTACPINKPFSHVSDNTVLHVQ